jgi:adenylate cyclase
MESIAAYLPADRRYALAQGVALPEAARGAVLYADISGFTRLTEGLARTLGPRRGAEELTHRLNQVYDALIAEVDRFGGSVIGFAGDAILCWFDDTLPPPAPGPAAARAAACGLALLEAIAGCALDPLPDGTLVTLALKVTVAAGPVRRFVVGDPDVQRVDVITGATVTRAAVAEGLAGQGELIVDAATAEALGEALAVAAWREDEESGERFALVGTLGMWAQPAPWPELAAQPLPDSRVVAWLIPAVAERLRAGLGEFLTELRPAVSLFMGFSGVDFVAHADAGSRLDRLVRWVQQVLERYAGTLLQVTIGEKGSFLYVAFGAPIGHEDDPIRGASAALALRSPPESLGFAASTRIGLTMGTMRTGAYGGTTRRTYGVLGDDVNLAARLMSKAQQAEVLVSGRVQRAVASQFTWESLAPMLVKGKSEPVSVARLLDARQIAAGEFSGPLVGRAVELAWLAERARPIFAGAFAGVIAINGEPGVGKSRLIFELRQLMERRGAGAVGWYSVSCDGVIRQSLNPLRYFAREYFGYEAALPEPEQRARFDAALDALIARARLVPQTIDLAGELTRTRSFLAALLDLRQENSLYERLEPKLRFENTLVAVRALVLAESWQRPFVLHIDDAHWLDEDSQALLRQLTRDAAAPFVLLLGGRTGDDGRRFAVALDDDVPRHTLDLGTLSEAGMRTLAGHLLGGPIDDTLLALLAEKTSANPFFVEQLLLDLRERAALTRDEDGVWQPVATALAEVPDSINAVLIARLDRLAAHVKAVVQTAAVLGNEFEVRVLSQMLRDSVDLPSVVRQAEAETIWIALNEIRYLFRHGLLRDAAYDMQLRSRLRALHALAAEALEQLYSEDLETRAADLAYHFGQAEERERERHYAALAGEYAAAQFANADAVAYLSRALELTPDDDLAARFALLWTREQVRDRQGEREAQLDDLAALRTLADAIGDGEHRVAVALRYGRYDDVTSDYPAMIAAARDAIALARQGASAAGQADGFLQLARALWYQGAYGEAEEEARRALALAREADDQRLEAEALRCLGNIAVDQANYAAAQAAYEQGLALHRALGDRQGESYTLNNLGTVAHYQGNYARARPAYEQYLAYEREVGDRLGQSIALSNLGEVALAQSDFATAQSFYNQALRISREIDYSLGECFVLMHLGAVTATLGDDASARATLEAALALSRAIRHRQQECGVLTFLCKLFHQQGDDLAALEQGEQALAIALEINDRNSQASALTVLGHARAGLGWLDQADQAYLEALALREVLGQATQTAEAQAGRVRVALARGNISGALAFAEPLLPQLDGGGLEGAFEPLRVFLTCYQALSIVGDARAQSVLAAGHRVLMEQAGRLDEATRQAFLERVSVHRELRAAFLAAGSAS